jgi:transposase
MIAASPATRIFLAITPIDMHKGFDGLYGLVSNHLGEDPRSGHLFVFTNNRRTRLKFLSWDGSGLWECSKRLERGRFRWPTADLCEADATTKMRLSTAALAMLLGGLDPVSVHLRPVR